MRFYEIINEEFRNKKIEEFLKDNVDFNFDPNKKYQYILLISDFKNLVTFSLTIIDDETIPHINKEWFEHHFTLSNERDNNIKCVFETKNEAMRLFYAFKLAVNGMGINYKFNDYTKT